jgi:hypothetical protein
LGLTANWPSLEIAVPASAAAIAGPANKLATNRQTKIRMAGIDLIFYSSHFSAILIGALTWPQVSCNPDR